MTIANDSRPSLMSPKEAAQVTTMSRVLLSMLAKEGKFPLPVKLGTKRIAYVRAEVEAWIAAKIEGRTN
ncbi:helix-turn-helix transcriptional regulator [Brucella intermedia]|uniref:helix-turn-helix transcriptional regulator n=1 Tax=Brucella intermedia TaxID=94625 RepID=UPI00235F60E6|nr:AlpA family phage regulatory protein [Brucella intermedia]